MIESFTLTNGVSIPSIFFGTWTFDDDTARSSVMNAINAGYRGIDTASYYNNETGVGIAVRGSTVARGDLFVSSKIWKTDMGYKRAKKAALDSLRRMGLDYLDLMLVHWPCVKGEDKRWEDINLSTWRALEELYEAGKLKAIGVSNFRREHLDVLVNRASVLPMVNQIEFHPGFAPFDTVDYCRSMGMIIEAWSPFGRGEALRHPTIREIAIQYGVSPAQLILCWIRQHSVVPITKATSVGHLLENLADTGMELTREEMERINAMEFFGRLGYDPNTISFDNQRRGGLYTAVR